MCVCVCVCVFLHNMQNTLGPKPLKANAQVIIYKYISP